MPISPRKTTKKIAIEPNFNRRDGRYLTRTNRTIYFGTKITPTEKSSQ